MRRRRSRIRPAARKPVWTLGRASGIGAAAGLAAILMAGLVGTGDTIRLDLYALLLGITAFCGASVLWITASDMRRRGTSGRMRPIRGFDLALGLLLLAPSLYALAGIWNDLPF